MPPLIQSAFFYDRRFAVQCFCDLVYKRLAVSCYSCVLHGIASFMEISCNTSQKQAIPFNDHDRNEKSSQTYIRTLAHSAFDRPFSSSDEAGTTMVNAPLRNGTVATVFSG